MISDTLVKIFLVVFFTFIGFVNGWDWSRPYHYADVASGQVQCELVEQSDKTKDWECEEVDND